jgi:hypothetical protein
MPSWERLGAFWASAVLGEASRRHIGGVLGRRRSVWEESWVFPAAVSVWKRWLGMDSCSQKCVPGARRFEDTFVFNWALVTALSILGMDCFDFRIRSQDHKLPYRWNKLGM